MWTSVTTAPFSPVLNGFFDGFAERFLVGCIRAALHISGLVNSNPVEEGNGPFAAMARGDDLLFEQIGDITDAELLPVFGNDREIGGPEIEKVGEIQRRAVLELHVVAQPVELHAQLQLYDVAELRRLLEGHSAHTPARFRSASTASAI